MNSNNNSSTNILSKLFNKVRKRKEIRDAVPELKPETEAGSGSEYVVVYYYTGSTSTYGIGHAAIWDGKRYYSFPDPTVGEGTLRAGQKRYKNDVEADRKHYGSYYKIILPKTAKLQADIDAIEANMAKRFQTVAASTEEEMINWVGTKEETTARRKAEYSLIGHNCADMTRTYLIESGYKGMNQIISKGGFILTPSDLAERVRTVGLKMMQQNIMKDRSIPRNDKEIKLMMGYLADLKLALNKSQLKGTLIHDMPTGIKELKMMMKMITIEDLNNPDVVSKLYFDVKLKLAQLHYSNSLTSMTRSTATHAFYTDWFEKTFDVQIELAFEHAESSKNTTQPAQSRTSDKPDTATVTNIAKSQQPWPLNDIKTMINSLDALYHSLGRSWNEKAIKQLLDKINQPDTNIDTITKYLEAEFNKAARNTLPSVFNRNSYNKYVKQVNDHPESYHYSRIVALMLDVIYKNDPRAGDANTRKYIRQIITNLSHPAYTKLADFIKRMDIKQQQQEAQWLKQLDNFNSNIVNKQQTFNVRVEKWREKNTDKQNSFLNNLFIKIDSIYNKLTASVSAESQNILKEELESAKNTHNNNKTNIDRTTDSIIANQFLVLTDLINKKSELISAHQVIIQAGVRVSTPSPKA